MRDERLTIAHFQANFVFAHPTAALAVHLPVPIGRLEETANQPNFIPPPCDLPRWYNAGGSSTYPSGQRLAAPAKVEATLAWMDEQGDVVPLATPGVWLNYAPTTMKNVKNGCYFSALLQLLLSSVHLRSALDSDSLANPASTVCAALRQGMDRVKEGKCVDWMNLRSALTNNETPDFAADSQRDPMEVLNELFAAQHFPAVSRCLVLRTVRRSVCTCCKTETSSACPLITLPVPLRSDDNLPVVLHGRPLEGGNLKMQDLVLAALQDESRLARCPKTEALPELRRVFQTFIDEAPAVLIVQLNRALYSDAVITDRVLAPESLALTGPGDREQYHLRAAVLHLSASGTRKSGHYITVVVAGEQSYVADDMRITPVSAAEALERAQSGYLFLYEASKAVTQLVEGEKELDLFASVIKPAGRRRNASAAPPTEPFVVAADTRTVSCKCMVNYDDGTPMILCDACGCWSHIACWPCKKRVPELFFCCQRPPKPAQVQQPADEVPGQARPPAHLSVPPTKRLTIEPATTTTTTTTTTTAATRPAASAELERVAKSNNKPIFKRPPSPRIQTAADKRSAAAATGEQTAKRSKPIASLSVSSQPALPTSQHLLNLVTPSGRLGAACSLILRQNLTLSHSRHQLQLEPADCTAVVTTSRAGSLLKLLVSALDKLGRCTFLPQTNRLLFRLAGLLVC